MELFVWTIELLFVMLVRSVFENTAFILINLSVLLSLVHNPLIVALEC